MTTVHLTFQPGDTVSYRDVQFDLPNAKLDHIKIHSFGIYARLEHDGESYTVKYEKLQKAEGHLSTE